MVTHWDHGLVISEIRRIFLSDQPLNVGHARKAYGGLVDAARLRFGSWKAAVEAAGIPYQLVSLQSKKKWNKQSIQAEIGSLVRARTPLNYMYVFRAHRSLQGGAKREYGSWKAALAAFCEANPALVKRVERLIKKAIYTKGEIQRERKWSKEIVIQKIRGLKKKGERLNSQGIRRKYPTLYGMARKFYGNWESAVQAAGIDYRLELTIWQTKRWVQELTDTTYAAAVRAGHRQAQRRQR